MIQTYSIDPDVQAAAHEAYNLIARTLLKMPKAETYDYGGHVLKLNAYDMCVHCTTAIAEAQTAEAVLRTEIALLDDETVKEHLELAARLLHVEAEAAIIRAELHNGHGTEPILNRLLGFMYERGIGDDYDHNHQKDQA